MSDLFEARRKTEDAAEWRGEINVSIDEDDDETEQLSVRQLYDPEFWEVMSKIDTDELEELQADLPEDKMDKFRELQDKDELTDEEETELSNMQAEIEQEDLNIFKVLSYETYEGLKTAAKYGVVPDEQDVRTALTNHTNEIQEQYGGTSNEDAKQYVNDHVIEPMIDNSVNLASFAIGVKVLGETFGDSKN